MPFFKPLNFENKPFRSERSVRAAGNPFAAAGATLAKGILTIQAGQNERENIARRKAAETGNSLEPRVFGELDVSPAPFEGAEGRSGLEIQQELGIEPLPEVVALAAKADKIRLRIAAGGPQAEGEDMLAVEFRKALRQIGPENMALQEGNLRNAMATVIGGRADRPIATGKGIDALGETTAIRAEQARGQALGINPKMMEGMDIATLRSVVSFRQRAEIEKKDHVDALNLENLEREVTGKRKEESLIKTNDILRRDAVSVLEPVKRQLNAFLDKLPPGTLPTGENLLPFEQILARGEFDLTRHLNAALDKKADNGGPSIGSRMSPKEREEAIAFGLTALTPYREMLTNKTTGMQSTAARFNDQAPGAALANEYQISEGLRKAMLIKKALGEGVISESLIMGDVKGFPQGVDYATQIVKSLNRVGESNGLGGAAAAQQSIALTGPSTQAERVAVMDKAGGGDPVINRGTAIAPLAALYEPTAPLDMKRHAYMSVYGPDNFDAAMKIAGTGTEVSAGRQLTYLNGTVSAANLAEVKKYGAQVGFDAVGGVTQYYIENLDNVSRQAKDTLTILGLTIDYDRGTETFSVPPQERPEPTPVDLFGGENRVDTLISNFVLVTQRIGDVVNTGNRNEAAEVLTEAVASLRAFGKAVGNTPEDNDASVGAWLFKNSLVNKNVAESYGLRFDKSNLSAGGDASTLLTSSEEGIVAPSAMTLEELLKMDDEGAMLTELRRRQTDAIALTDRLKTETDALNESVKSDPDRIKGDKGASPLARPLRTK